MRKDIIGTKTDCFAYNAKGTDNFNRCNALNCLCCDKSLCNFYKTKEEEEKQRKEIKLKRLYHEL